MGIARPGDMGFDVMHMNLHKTFSTPHGGGGPGSGPVACKEFLTPYLPGRKIIKTGDDGGYDMTSSEESETSVGMFWGNALVVVKALAYLMSLGSDGIPYSAQNAVLNANYMKSKLEDIYDVPYGEICMHEFVISAEKLKRETGVAPTIYFPLIVNEAMMFEPTETESRETIDDAVEVLRKIYRETYEAPEKLHEAPHNAQIKRPDEVLAARQPVCRYESKEKE